MSGDWYVLIGKKPVGPASGAEVLRAHLLGRYDAEAMVRSGQDGEWRSLSSVFPLEQLTPPPLPAEWTAAAHPLEAQTWTRDTPYAWRRYFARQLDTIIHALIMFVFLGAVLAGHDGAYLAVTGLDNQIVLNIIGVMLSIIPGAILLGVTGRTVGKLIFGVKILNARGKPPGMFRALKRELQVLLQGLALGIPLVTLFTFIGGYNTLQKHGRTDWDKSNELVAWYRRPTFVHWVLMLGGIALWLGIVVTLYAAGRDAG
jgi:uncharacterized RDD family membrane protein YckC